VNIRLPISESLGQDNATSKIQPAQSAELLEQVRNIDDDFTPATGDILLLPGQYRFQGSAAPMTSACLPTGIQGT
jgi:hypothetical protein